MKIALITLPLENNYGGILQNYALQQVLRSMGHHPVTMRWPAYTLLGYCRRVLLAALRGFRGMPHPSPGEYRHQRAGMEGFIQQHIAYRWTRHPAAQLRRLRPDALVVGSDQVWRAAYNGPQLPRMFLSFAQGKPNIKRISYAASLGTATWEMDEPMTRRCAELLREFNAVSVREQEAVPLIEQHMGVKAQWVLDPTMLLPRDHWLQLAKTIPAEDPTVLLYSLDAGPDVIREAQAFAASQGLPLQVMRANAGVTHDDSPQRWLARLRDARYVITDSFHGTAFSILLGRQFVSLCNQQRGASRFTSLLAPFGLQSRLVPQDHPEQLPSALSQEIDYAKVLPILQSRRHSSLQFLQAALR